uniref:Metallo-beta-lactamase domain containing 2 n=1 Tax=Anolis carolinensis TaxID=28377 RepID=G1KP12_ANOCA
PPPPPKAGLPQWAGPGRRRVSRERAWKHPRPLLGSSCFPRFPEPGFGIFSGRRRCLRWSGSRTSPWAEASTGSRSASTSPGTGPTSCWCGARSGTWSSTPGWGFGASRINSAWRGSWRTRKAPKPRRRLRESPLRDSAPCWPWPRTCTSTTRAGCTSSPRWPCTAPRTRPSAAGTTTRRDLALRGRGGAAAQASGGARGTSGPPVQPTHVLQEGDVISLGDRQLTVMHMPGHSRGSICLHDSERKILFSGDVVYDGSMIDWLPYSRINDYVASCQRLIELANGGLVEKVLPGHFNTFGAERLYHLASNYISNAGVCHKVSTCAMRSVASLALRATNSRSTS